MSHPIYTLSRWLRPEELLRPQDLLWEECHPLVADAHITTSPRSQHVPQSVLEILNVVLQIGTTARLEANQCINFNDLEVGETTQTVEEETQVAGFQRTTAAKGETDREGTPDDGRISESSDHIDEPVAVRVLLACIRQSYVVADVPNHVGDRVGWNDGEYRVPPLAVKGIHSVEHVNTFPANQPRGVKDTDKIIFGWSVNRHRYLMGTEGMNVVVHQCQWQWFICQMIWDLEQEPQNHRSNLRGQREERIARGYDSEGWLISSCSIASGLVLSCFIARYDVLCIVGESIILFRHFKRIRSW